MGVVRNTYNSGLLGLGQLARHGSATNGSGLLLKNILERAGIDVAIPRQKHIELLATLARPLVAITKTAGN